MKRFISFILLLLLFVHSTQAQGISYTYDAAGNRTLCAPAQGLSLDAASSVNPFGTFSSAPPLLSPRESADYPYDRDLGSWDNTAGYSGTHSYILSGNEVVYRVELVESMRIVVEHAGSTVTRSSITLLDEAARVLATSTNTTGLATLDYITDPGIHYIKSVNTGSASGTLAVQVGGYFMDPSEDGFGMDEAIELGSWPVQERTGTDSYTDNTYCFPNLYEDWPMYDIWHTFTLEGEADVVLSHAGSALSSTYMALLDEAGERLELSTGGAPGGTQAFIHRTLPAGTYYVVSEGHSTNGSITLTLEIAPNEFGYSTMPDGYSMAPEAVRGPGGSLSVSPLGAAVYTLPLEVPAGSGGLQPSLSLVYNSQSGNGVAGWGCSIGGLSAITRGPKDIYHDGIPSGLTHGASDAYYLDGKRLLLASGSEGVQGAVYHPEDDPFTTVTVGGTSPGIHFTVERAGDGMTCRYGSTADARQSYTTASGLPRVHAWFLDSVEDSHGNRMTCSYTADRLSPYLQTVSYGGNSRNGTAARHTVEFAYEERADSVPFFLEGVSGSLRLRLKSVSSSTDGTLFRRYDLSYDTTTDGTALKFSRLKKVTPRADRTHSLKPLTLYWDHLPGGGMAATEVEVTEPMVVAEMPFDGQQYLSGDLNGDGLTDLVGIAPVELTSGNYTEYHTYAYVYYASPGGTSGVEFPRGRKYDLGADFVMADMKAYRGHSSFLDVDGNGINEFIVPRVNVNDYFQQIVFYAYTASGGYWGFPYDLQATDEMPLYTVADLNSDGRGEIIFLETGADDSGVTPGGIMHLPDGDTFRTPLSFTLPEAAGRLFATDCNGDGLTDLLLFRESGYTIYWNRGGSDLQALFSESDKSSGVTLCSHSTVEPGDFNGDGLTDFLLNKAGSGEWHFALNNGDGTFDKCLAATLDLYDQTFTEKDNNRTLHCDILDFDRDGRSDVVLTKALYHKESDLTGSYGVFDKTYTYWLRSDGRSLSRTDSATSLREEDAYCERYLTGDFTGDGLVELLNYGYDCADGSEADGEPRWLLYSNYRHSPSTGKVIRLVDSYGNEEHIGYASLANGGHYTKGSGGIYPVVDLTLPLHAVSRTTSTNGSVSTRTVRTYSYGGLKGHLQGKGLLGMGYFRTDDTPSGTFSETEVLQWDTLFHAPARVAVRNGVDSLAAVTTTTFSFTGKGGRLHFAAPVHSVATDPDGNTVTTVRTYDTSTGMPASETVTHGEGMYRETLHADHVKAGGRYLPQLITETDKHEDDSVAFVRKTRLTYDSSTGDVVRRVEHYGSSAPLTTVYTYDTWGNRTGSTVSGTGVPAKTELYEYDTDGRFVVRKSTLPASTVTAYTYDIRGNLLAETDETDSANPLTTSYTYDAWGSRISTLRPDGTKEYVTTGWGVEQEKRYFILTQGTGQPWVKTWYDSRGREVQRESRGARDLLLQDTLRYNAKGELSCKSRREGLLLTSESYTYDLRGRLLSHRHSSGRETLYSYGNRTDTTTVNGRLHVKTYDAWGHVKRSEDPASSVSYTYASHGLPKEVEAGGATLRLTYTDKGERATLIDPDAGTTGYAYDAAGRLIRRTDGNGKVTQHSYDTLGRLSSTTIDGTATLYSYDSLGRLVKEERDGLSTSYSYDSLNRLSTETRQTEGESLTFSYAYDGRGRLSAVTYPADVTVFYGYEADGTTATLSVDGTTVWSLTDDTGLTRTATLGGSLRAVSGRDTLGLPCLQQVMTESLTLHDMRYSFNGATGTLTSRSGMFATAERFTYDSVDRLTGVSGGSSLQMTYRPDGNLNYKSDIGAYTYDVSATGKPHAVVSVANDGGRIGDSPQSVSYTAFNKAKSITQGDSRLELTYGPDLQRWKSVLTENGTAVRTTLHAGDYERVTEGGVTRHFYYLYGCDGLAAIHVKEESGNGSSSTSGSSTHTVTSRTYYPCLDHLGSIVKLVDSAGSVAYAATYDAWGRRTVSVNSLSFQRGYTGHEHLDSFGLVNMNGRMYDPALGRFLSPDPYVQLPDFSQNFNRYSYCLNNPLMYTDPSGEWFWLVPVVGAVVNWAANGADFTWEGLSYAVVGAASTTLTVLYPQAYLGIAAATGASNSVLYQGFNNGWGNIRLDQMLVDTAISTIFASVTSTFGAQVAPALGRAFDGIKSPLLREGLKGMISGTVSGAFLGGIIAEVDDDENTSFGDGLFKGATMGALTGTLSGVANAAQYAQKNKVNLVTGKSKLPGQIHHYATNKNSDYTSDMKKIADKYGLDLDGNWNKETLPHRGRHPNDYHKWVLDRMMEIDKMPNMNRQEFLRQFDLQIKQPVRNNPMMLRKEFWINK